jgi:GntR family transcriptional regulator/MocR family aminotransferase
LLRCGPSDVGLDVCAHFRGGHAEDEVARRALAAGIDVRALGYYTHPAAGTDCAADPGLVLGFSAFTPQQIRTGVAGLARIFDGLKHGA